MSSLRVGQGFDAHRLVPGHRLLLGGVEIPYERGLEGHSDGDCLLHAICDALLGAAALGDLGSLFPSSDPRWRGAASRVFLDHVLDLVSERGFRLENIDSTLLAEEPRLAPHLPKIQARLAEALGLPLEAVSVKAKSPDGMGALGRGEGIAAQAVALLRRG